MANPVSARLSRTYGAADGRKFGFTVGSAFGALAAFAWWRGHPTTFTLLATLGGALALAALVAPTALRTVEDGWMKLAHVISRVTTPIFMGVVYYVVITPVGALRRSRGGSALVHRAGPHGFWVDRTASPPSALDRLF